MVYINLLHNKNCSLGKKLLTIKYPENQINLNSLGFINKIIKIKISFLKLIKLNRN